MSAVDKESSASCSIFVCKLVLGTTEEDIYNYFKQFGNVENIFMKGNTYAFVDFMDAQSVKKVLAFSHEIKGKRVTTTLSKCSRYQVYVSRENLDLPDAELYQYFSRFGPIFEYKTPRNTLNQRRGYFFITYGNKDTATKVMGMTHCLNGKKLKVGYSTYTSNHVLKRPKNKFNMTRFTPYSLNNSNNFNVPGQVVMQPNASTISEYQHYNPFSFNNFNSLHASRQNLMQSNNLTGFGYQHLFAPGTGMASGGIYNASNGIGMTNFLNLPTNTPIFGSINHNQYNFGGFNMNCLIPGASNPIFNNAHMLNNYQPFFLF